MHLQNSNVNLSLTNTFSSLRTSHYGIAGDSKLKRKVAKQQQASSCEQFFAVLSSFGRLIILWNLKTVNRELLQVL